jgi:hypothetical protein
LFIGTIRFLDELEGMADKCVVQRTTQNLGAQQVTGSGISLYFAGTRNRRLLNPSQSEQFFP